jgi:hypothetical protein
MKKDSEKKMTKLEAVVLSIKFWTEMRDKGYLYKSQVDKPELSRILEMQCSCPLCEYAKDNELHLAGRDFCEKQCPLSLCARDGQPYKDWSDSTTPEEASHNADRVVKQLKRYVSRKMKKKLVLN